MNRKGTNELWTENWIRVDLYAQQVFRPYYCVRRHQLKAAARFMSGRLQRIERMKKGGKRKTNDDSREVFDSSYNQNKIPIYLAAVFFSGLT